MNTLLYIYGHSATGKSTLAELIQNKNSNWTIVDFDIEKRKLPNYDWTLHAQAGRDLTLNKLVDTMKTHQTIIFLYPYMRNKNEFEALEKICSSNEYGIIAVELHAPSELLVQRYQKRMANLDPEKQNWKFKTIDEFTARLQESYYSPPDAMSFDSSIDSPQNILNEILKVV